MAQLFEKLKSVGGDIDSCLCCKLVQDDRVDFEDGIGSFGSDKGSIVVFELTIDSTVDEVVVGQGATELHVLSEDKSVFSVVLFLFNFTVKVVNQSFDVI